MKKNRIFTILTVLVFFTFNSCSDYLEAEPKSFWVDGNFYSNKAEVGLAINGIYSQLANDEVYGWVFNVMIEAGTDETYTNDPTPTWAEAKYEHTSASDRIKDVWLQFYTSIQLVNQLEKNTSPSIFENEAEYKSVIAKAYFMRAFSYFNLVNWFGPVPLRLTPSASQEDNNLAPSPVLDVYKQVEKDLLFAAENLLHATHPDYIQGEPSKMAAHGMLARLYLRMGGFQPYLTENRSTSYFENSQEYFQKAQQQCEIVMNDGFYGLTPHAVDSESYRNHFLSYLQDRYDLKESLFEISFGNLEIVGLRVSGRLGNINGVEFVGTGAERIPRGFCKINASVPLLNAYAEEDTRRTWNIAGYRNKFNAAAGTFVMSYIYNFPLNEEFAPGKFRRWEPKDLEALKEQTIIPGAEYTILNNTPGSDTDPNYTSINFPILRFSDILLMHAEAVIGGKNGTANANSSAVNSLNIVRERAGLTPYEGSLNHNDFFNEIVDERLRELCFEGLRKQDLIRWDLLEEKLLETNQTIQNLSAFRSNSQFHQTYLDPGVNFQRSKHFFLPYPIQETQINNKLDQRAGW